MRRWVSSEGHEVDSIVIEGRPLLRVRHLGYHIGYCASVAEVAAHVDLADLVEVVDLRHAARARGQG
ncbi:transposase [Microbispora catharanthi]|uniref:Transposase n=1 Tax=Microbispora catharanthi TaxID=1712871 RepID=A0A5N6BVH4_9ACTN|nr:transposase [Microbispora catharanthi]KAB8184441.1 transposase [Microbispora catharanthi]